MIATFITIRFLLILLILILISLLLSLSLSSLPLSMLILLLLPVLRQLWIYDCCYYYYYHFCPNNFTVDIFATGNDQIHRCWMIVQLFRSILKPQTPKWSENSTGVRFVFHLLLPFVAVTQSLMSVIIPGIQQQSQKEWRDDKIGDNLDTTIALTIKSGYCYNYYMANLLTTATVSTTTSATTTTVTITTTSKIEGNKY